MGLYREEDAGATIIEGTMDRVAVLHEDSNPTEMGDTVAALYFGAVPAASTGRVAIASIPESGIRRLTPSAAPRRR